MPLIFDPPVLGCVFLIFDCIITVLKVQNDYVMEVEHTSQRIAKYRGVAFHTTNNVLSAMSCPVLILHKAWSMIHTVTDHLEVVRLV